MALRLASSLVIASLVASVQCLAAGDQFHLRSHETDIGWLNVFNRQGTAVLASYETANATDDLVPLIFTVVSTGEKVTDNWVITASPDASAPVQNQATRSPSFSNVTVIRQVVDSKSRTVCFTNDTSTPDIVANPFRVISTYLGAYRRDHYGAGFTLGFQAFPTEMPGIWTLAWNASFSEYGSNWKGLALRTV